MGSGRFEWSARRIGISCLALLLFLTLVFHFTALSEPQCGGMPLSQWLRKANQNDIGDLAKVGPAAIPILAKSLKPPNPLWHGHYRKIWEKLPNAFRARLPSPYQSQEIRQKALLALRQFGDEAKPVLPEIIEAARHDPDLYCRNAALNAAAAVGHSDPEVSALFQERLKDSTDRNLATVVPFECGLFPSNCIPDFLSILSDQTKLPYNALLGALLGISVLGPGAAEAVPTIIEALKNPKIAANAVTAICNVGPTAEPAVPALVPLLETTDLLTLTKVCEALMNIGPAASATLPSLKKLTMHEDVTVRIMAAAAIAKISGDVHESLPILTAGLKRNQHSKSFWQFPDHRFGLELWSFNYPFAAAWFLGELAPASRETLPLLKESLKDCPDWMLSALAHSIWKIEGKPDEAIPILKQALGAKGDDARIMACLVLAEMGSVAQDAVPDLQAACKINLNLRAAARYALRKIQPDRPLPQDL